MARVVRERGISTPVQNVACPSPASCSDREPPAFALHRSREQRCRNSPRPGRTSLMGCQPLLHKLRSQSETQEVHRKTRNASQKRTHTENDTDHRGSHMQNNKKMREARRETVANVCDLGCGLASPFGARSAPRNGGQCLRLGFGLASPFGARSAPRNCGQCLRWGYGLASPFGARSAPRNGGQCLRWGYGLASAFGARSAPRKCGQCLRW